ncbi:hypothetical protein ACOME3_005874 [Neoechinorhynchus agilis]
MWKIESPSGIDVYYRIEPLEQPSLPQCLAYQKTVLCCLLNDFNCIKNGVNLLGSDIHRRLISYRLTPAVSAILALDSEDHSDVLYDGIPLTKPAALDAMMQLWSIAGEHWPIMISDHEAASDYRHDWSKLGDPRGTSMLSRRCIVNLLTDARYGPNVYPVSGPNNDRALDIVFIHGFNGSAFFTWRQQGFLHHHETPNFTFCWPRDWLATDLKSTSVRILMIDYDSDWSYDTIHSAVREQLITAGIGERPLILVGHSMGGIIAKRLICEETKIANVTKAIVFYSVPHLGTDHLMQKSRVSPQNLRKLSSNNPYLSNLHNRFINCVLSRSIEFLSFCELLPMNGFAGTMLGNAPVVTVTDADIGIGRFITSQKTHVNICKFEDRKCSDYLEMVGLVNDIIENLDEKDTKRYECFFPDFFCPFQ